MTATTGAEAVLAVLERNRATFAWKVRGLRQEDYAATTAASTMTLGGLLKHVALVETDWLVVKLAGEEYGSPWDAVDFDADPNWEWRTGASDPADELFELWKTSVERSRQVVNRVLLERGPDAAANWQRGSGESPSIFEMLLDMVEEYARHLGHADLLREAIDGSVGEGAPASFTY